MSYYAPINFSNDIKSQDINQTDNIYKKDKFVYNDNPVDSTPGYYLLPHSKTSLIDNESNLMKPIMNSKDKTKLELTDNLHPDNYNINYSNNSKNSNNSNNKQFNYCFENKNVGAGRGFGNLNISNQMRGGDTSRKDNKEFREYREGRQSFEHQFQYLNRNYQDPNHLVMPIPRGGEMTRKQNQLDVNTMRNPDPNSFEDDVKQFKFTY